MSSGKNQVASLSNQKNDFVGKSSSSKDKLRAIFQQSGLIVILLGLVVLFSILTSGNFLSRSNIMNILLQSSVRGIAAVGMTFVILKGGIDLSVGGMATLIGCIGAWLMTKSVSPVITIPLMLLLGCFLGALNGLAVSRWKMAPFIVTLASWQVFEGAAYQFTHGGQTIYGLPKKFSIIGQGYLAAIPVPVIIFVIVAIFGFFILHHTTYGRKIYAVGGNETSAWLSGINTKRIVLSVYIVAGICAGIAAIVTVSRIMCATVAMSIGLELDAIAAVVIGGISLQGGQGFIVGAIIGALIIGVINNGLNLAGVDPYIQDIVKGAIIFTAIAVDSLRK